MIRSSNIKEQVKEYYGRILATKHDLKTSCGNSAAMVGETRFCKHFRVSGDRSTHFGPFDCAPAAAKEATGDPRSGGSCC